MSVYHSMNPNQLSAEYANVNAHYEACKAQNLKLNMARGKPGADQLRLSAGGTEVRPGVLGRYAGL